MVEIEMAYITEYHWRSSIDGFLSNRRYFSARRLSAGTNTIYFKVRDDRGVWSKEMKIRVEVKK